jgi:hypothetical protein
MAKEHELELIHQAKQQATEKEQQQELMRYDQRAEYRDFIKQRSVDEEQLKRTFKVFKQQKRKDLNTKQIKDQIEKKRIEWQAEQDKKESEFLKQQRIEKEEEETLLRKYHENLVAQSKKTALEARNEVSKGHKEAILGERNEHETALRVAEKEHWTDRLDTTKKQHEEQFKLVAKYKTDQQALVKTNREEYIKIQQEWLAALTQLCTTQNRLMELKDFQVILQQFVDDGLHKYDKSEKMVARVIEEELQVLKLSHAEEVNLCIETSPIDLISPDRNRKSEKVVKGGGRERRNSKTPTRKKQSSDVKSDSLNSSTTRDGEIPSLQVPGNDSEEEDTPSIGTTDGSSTPTPSTPSSSGFSRRGSKVKVPPSKPTNMLKETKDKNISQSSLPMVKIEGKAPRRAASDATKKIVDKDKEKDKGQAKEKEKLVTIESPREDKEVAKEKDKEKVEKSKSEKSSTSSQNQGQSPPKETKETPKDKDNKEKEGWKDGKKVKPKGKAGDSPEKGTADSSEDSSDDGGAKTPRPRGQAKSSGSDKGHKKNLSRDEKEGIIQTEDKGHKKNLSRDDKEGVIQTEDKGHKKNAPHDKEGSVQAEDKGHKQAED